MPLVLLNLRLFFTQSFLSIPTDTPRCIPTDAPRCALYWSLRQTPIHSSWESRRTGAEINYNLKTESKTLSTRITGLELSEGQFEIQLWDSCWRSDFQPLCWSHDTSELKKWQCHLHFCYNHEWAPRNTCRNMDCGEVSSQNSCILEKMFWQSPVSIRLSIEKDFIHICSFKTKV